jgi:diguanylate cyclase (GGDEF)-like protein
VAGAAPGVTHPAARAVSRVLGVATVSTHTPARPAVGANGGDPLLEALRRLMRLADGDGDAEAIHRALARELCALLGVEEMQVHQLAAGAPRPGGGEEGEAVVAYMFGGEGRLAYLAPRSERQPGVARVARTGRAVSAAGARELADSLPLLAARGVGSALALALAVRGEVEAVVVLARRRPEPWPEDAIQRAALLVEQAGSGMALLRARAEAGTDAVTGCMNRRAMRRRLREEIDRAARTGGRLACLLIDLDDFKQVNDRHGHPAGDAVLRGVARALMGEFRAFDRVARYGGDEFVVILPNADLPSAALAGERALRRLAAVSSFDRAGAGVGGSIGVGAGVGESIGAGVGVAASIGVGVAASIGAAEWRPSMSPEQLLQACDAALLRSKRTGKGHVELAGGRGAQAAAGAAL